MVRDKFNREIQVGDLVTGAGGYRSLATGVVTGFTPTGMLKVLGYAWGARIVKVNIRNPHHSLLTDWRSLPTDKRDELMSRALEEGVNLR